jgi:hypothetical protein
LTNWYCVLPSHASQLSLPTAPASTTGASCCSSSTAAAALLTKLLLLLLLLALGGKVPTASAATDFLALEIATVVDRKSKE